MQIDLGLFSIRLLSEHADCGHFYDAAPNYVLIGLSYLFAAGGSYVGLLVAQEHRGDRTVWEKAFWLAAGATAMGAGIWAMHFVGMLANRLSFEVRYDVFLSALSIVPAVGASLIALLILGMRRARLPHLLAGGVLMGAGIGAMHYTGLAAMRMEMGLAYDPVLFVLSIVVAVVLAFVALGVKARAEWLTRWIHPRWANVTVALVMGLAISAMHYTASFATRFETTIPPDPAGLTFDDGMLIVMIIALLFVFILMVLLAIVARSTYRTASLIGMAFRKSADGFVLCRPDRSITLFSPGAERMFGLPEATAVGSDFLSLFAAPPDELSAWLDRTRDERGAGTAGDLSCDLVAARRDGAAFHVALNVSTVDLGRETLLLATLRDITGRKELEQARERATAELEEALARQTELNQKQREFVSLASHEIRTPLAVIDSAVQKLRRKAVRGTAETVEVIETCDKIRGTVKHMLLLLQTTLAAARTDAGKLVLEFARCDLAELVREVCQAQQDVSRSHRIALDMPDELPPVVADRAALGQVFANLLSNAVKYSPDAPDIDVVLRAQQGAVTIAVSDRGIGFDAEDKDRLFQRFFRAKSSIGIPGTGIGLSLVKELVDRHDGSIEVESELGVGTTFTVRLPVAAVREEPAAAWDDVDGFRAADLNPV